MSSQLHHLEVERTPEPAIDFDSQAVSVVQTIDIDKAALSDNQNICWTISGACISFYATSSGTFMSSFSFSHEDDDCITAVCTFSDVHKGLDVCIVSVHTSTADMLYFMRDKEVFKSLRLPSRCVSIECCSKNDNFNQSVFKNFEAFLILGFEPARVLVVDLNCDAAKVSAVAELKESDYSRLARSDGKFLYYVSLDACVADKKTFRYVNSDGSCIKTFYTEVSVTCIKYFESLDVLAVGYSVGCFQLFSLVGLELMFSSEVMEEFSSQISNFLFHVPQDDPRRCIYLWVGHSNKPVDVPAPNVTTRESRFGLDHYEEDFASVLMYQINFDDGGTCDLRACRPWFRLSLRPDIMIKRDNCLDLFNRSSIMSLGFCSRDETGSGYCGSQIYMCWKFWNDGCHLEKEVSVSNCEFQVGLFDLNCWYEAQMPQSVRVLTNQRFCPYFCVYDCPNVFDSSDMVPLDFAVRHNSMAQFQFLEYPTPCFASFLCSFGLECLFVTEKGVLNCEVQSIQSAVIESIEDLQNFDSSNIDALYKAALLSKLIDPVSSDMESFEGQLKGTLGLLAKHGRHESLLKICNFVKANEEHILGTNFYEIVQLVWTSFDNLCDTLHAFCAQLFGLETLELDEGFKRQFANYFCQIESYFNFCQSFCRKFGYQEGPVTLEELEAVRKVLEYFKVLDWLLDSDYLPEMDSERMDTDLQSGFVFPSLEIETLYDESVVLVKQNSSSKLLLFELLLESLNIELDYPAKSFESVVKKLFLSSKVAAQFEVRLALINYILMDIVAVCNADSLHHAKEVIVLPEDQKNNWMSLVRALWFLDHGSAELSASIMLDCNLNSLPENFLFIIITRFFAFKNYWFASALLRKYNPKPFETQDRMTCMSLHLFSKDLKAAAAFVTDDNDLCHYLEEVERFELQNCIIDLDWETHLGNRMQAFLKSQEGRRFAYLAGLRAPIKPRSVLKPSDTVALIEKTQFTRNIVEISKILQDVFPDDEKITGRIGAIFENKLRLPVVSEENVNNYGFLHSKVVVRNVNKAMPERDVKKMIDSKRRMLKIADPRLHSAASRFAEYVSSPCVKVRTKELDDSFNNTSLISSPAALSLLNPAEVTRNSHRRVNRSGSFSSTARRSILKSETSESGLLDSPVLGRALQNLKPGLSTSFGVCGLSPVGKGSFPNSPVARSKSMLCSKSKDSSYPNKESSFLNVSVGGMKSKGRIYVDEEVSIRKADGSVSSTEDHNVTAVNEDLVLTDDDDVRKHGNKVARVNCSVRLESEGSPFEELQPGSLLFHSPTVLADNPSESADDPDKFDFSAPNPMHLTDSSVKFRSVEINYSTTLDSRGFGDREASIQFTDKSTEDSMVFEKSRVELESKHEATSAKMSKSYWEFKPRTSLEESMVVGSDNQSSSLPVVESLSKTTGAVSESGSKSLKGVKKSSVRRTRSQRSSLKK